MLSAVSAVLYTAAGAECCLLYASCPEAGYRHTFLVGALMVMHDAVGFLERRGFRPLETPFDGTTSLLEVPAASHSSLYFKTKFTYIEMYVTPYF